MGRAPFTPAPRRSGQYTLYSKPEYFKVLARRIRDAKSGQRVLVTAMTFKQTNGPIDPLVKIVLDELAAAARRGAQVFFSIDAHEFLIHGRLQLGPLWFSKTMPARLPKAFAEKLAWLEKLRKAGVQVGITNQPGKRFTSPVAGRSHIKAAIIGNDVFVGGCNLSDSRELDLMVSWHSPTVAEWLFGHLHTMITSQDTRATFGSTDLTFQTNQTDALLIDAGVRRQSLIYQHALEVIERAERWLIITCQYSLNGETGMALKRAYARGVAVRPLFNHPGQHLAPFNVPQHMVKSRERFRLPREFYTGELPKHTPYLHAKLIASEQEAMVGSHNYVTTGVNFGTAEIATHIRQPSFARTAAAFMTELTGLDESTRFAFLRNDT